MSISNTALASFTNCEDGANNNNCLGTVLVSSTHIIRYTVTITWDGMTASSGSGSQSTIGDQMYQCILNSLSGGDDRTRTLAIKGIVQMLFILCYQNYISISTSNCSLFSY